RRPDRRRPLLPARVAARGPKGDADAVARLGDVPLPPQAAPRLPLGGGDVPPPPRARAQNPRPRRDGPELLASSASISTPARLRLTSRKLLIWRKPQWNACCWSQSTIRSSSPT